MKHHTFSLQEEMAKELDKHNEELRVAEKVAREAKIAKENLAIINSKLEERLNDQQNVIAQISLFLKEGNLVGLKGTEVREMIEELREKRSRKSNCPLMITSENS